MAIILKLTRHALEKMAMLGVNASQVRTAIERGSKFRQADGYLAHYGYIKVAYKVIAKNVYKVKTVFVD